MKQSILLLVVCIIAGRALSQSVEVSLDKGWQFKEKDSGAVNFFPGGKWYPASVPGTVHTDLVANKLIADPFYRDNESKVQWVEKKTWIYKKVFDVDEKLRLQKQIELEFDGLDTYASLILNGQNIGEADNMFRQWKFDVKSLLKPKGNVLYVIFYPAAAVAKLQKEVQELAYPDNERVFVRKAQYQFGWDWGPRLVTCGLWKRVRLVGRNKQAIQKINPENKKRIALVTEKDSIGESFYFTVDGKPTFIKGTNWIPADSFLPRAKKLKRYEQLIKAAKEANINMIRVWGGGVYEDDEFYDLCDKYGIMVWQDFMFAGALYPADSAFLKNIEEEVRFQVQRLRHHPCIAIWCGNNEIEEAWFNWGWQKEFNYSAEDSLKLWNNYRKIFHQLIPGILKELDPERPYWPSSPSLGWGRNSAYKKGDVHYWGVWWGKEPVEKYNEKVGRFVSEYGMQGMPDMKSIRQFSLPQDWDTTSAVMRTHQKHPYGWEYLKYYIQQKFRIPKTFEDLVYVSQLMQANAIKTAIEAHRGNQPKTMGTLFWQWNDCWPVTSWSAIDYYGRKKALYYEVKRSFKDKDLLVNFKENELSYKLDVSGDSLSDVTFIIHNFSNDSITTTAIPQHNYGQSFSSGKKYRLKNWNKGNKEIGAKVEALKNNETLASNIILFTDPKNTQLQRPIIKLSILKNTFVIRSDKFAYGVFIDVPDGVELADNYFHLLPNEKKTVNFTSTISFEKLKRSIKIKSLVDTY